MPNKAGFLAQPGDRPLREVAAGGRAPGARTPAGGDGGFEQAQEPAVKRAARAGVADRLPHLVQDLVFADDRAFQAGRDSDQVADRAFTGDDLEARVQLWRCPESVELHSMARI